MIKTAPHKAAENYLVPALEKGLDVLELMAGETQSLSLKELADRLDRTSQELFRVAMTLVARGYLLRDDAQRYRISTRLFELGNQQAATQALVARAMPHMERLAAESNESCHLSIVVQDRMLVVSRAECAQDVKISVRVGANYAMHERVSGRVALAWLSEDRRQAYWERHPQADATGLEKQLRQMRKRGYEQSDSPLIVGGQDVAAPVLSPDGTLLAVLCLTRLRRVGEDVELDQFAADVKQTAQAISAEFGFSLDAARTNRQN